MHHDTASKADLSQVLHVLLMSLLLDATCLDATPALKAFVARMQEAPPLPAPRIVTQLFDIPSPIRWPSAEVSAEH